MIFANNIDFVMVKYVQNALFVKRVVSSIFPTQGVTSLVNYDAADSVTGAVKMWPAENCVKV